MDVGKQILPRLNRAASERLIRDGVATGGMQAKLEAAHRALDGGVGQVVIAPGAVSGIVARLADGEMLGTRLDN
jgi:acetylglutamate kinase